MTKKLKIFLFKIYNNIYVRFHIVKQPKKEKSAQFSSKFYSKYFLFFFFNRFYRGSERLINIYFLLITNNMLL
jgi:hypothetical protein